MEKAFGLTWQAWGNFAPFRHKRQDTLRIRLRLSFQLRSGFHLRQGFGGQVGATGARPNFAFFVIFVVKNQRLDFAAFAPWRFD